TEGSADNIFIVKDGKIKTPPVCLGALEGVTRNVIIALAKERGYEMDETPFTRHDVYIAEEVFFTATAAKVIPVIEVDGRLIDDGKPGNVTKDLLETFRKCVTTQGVQCYS